MSRPARGPIVVVAGIPGAGKTTALRELAKAHPHHGSRIVDSDSVRRSLQARFPGVPYPILRPLVHTLHWARIVVLAVTETDPLLIHETATRPRSRVALLRIARVTSRSARMVWIDVDARTAQQGQRLRNRIIRPTAFRRHLQLTRLRHPAQAAAPTWDVVHRTDRAGAVQAIRAALDARPSDSTVPRP